MVEMVNTNPTFRQKYFTKNDFIKNILKKNR